MEINFIREKNINEFRDKVYDYHKKGWSCVGTFYGPAESGEMFFYAFVEKRE